LKDGRHLLVYNHTAADLKDYVGNGRARLNLAVSRDGLTWQAALELENETKAERRTGSFNTKKIPRIEFSYPAIIQTSDGLVHITYTWKRQRIKHVVIDPRKLVLRDMPNGHWPD